VATDGFHLHFAEITPKGELGAGVILPAKAAKILIKWGSVSAVVNRRGAHAHLLSRQWRYPALPAD